MLYPKLVKTFLISWAVFFCLTTVSLAAAAVKPGPKLSTGGPVSKTAKNSMGMPLAFEKPGTVSKVFVNVNDTVHKGQELVALDTEEALALLRQAETDVAMEKIKLDQLEQGEQEGDRATLDSVRLSNAREALEDAKQSVIYVLEDGYTKAEDAVRNRTDQFFSNMKTVSPQVIFLAADVNSKAALSIKRVTMENLFASWKSFLDGLTSASDLPTAIDSHLANLLQVRDFLDAASAVINSVNSDPNVSALTLRSWKTDVYTGRANVNTSLKDTIAIKMKLREAQSQVALQLANKAKSAPLQKVRLKQAQAKKDLLQVALNKMSLFAPADGTVTRVLVAPGSVIKFSVPAVYFKFAKTALTNPNTTP